MNFHVFWSPKLSEGNPCPKRGWATPKCVKTCERVLTPPAKHRNLKVVHRYLRENMQMRLKFLQVRCHVYNTLPNKFGWQVTG